jgi:hypothetical protein
VKAAGHDVEGRLYVSSERAHRSAPYRQGGFTWAKGTEQGDRDNWSRRISLRNEDKVGAARRGCSLDLRFTP